MLRILPDPVKHIIQPFRFLPGQIAHPGQQEILRFLLIHEPQLVRKELRGCEIIDHMPASHVVSGIAVFAADRTADHEIHVLYLIFYANAHILLNPTRFY